MSYEMRNLRKEDLSLYYYLKEIVLSDFVEQEEYIPLEYSAELSDTDSYVYQATTDMLPIPTSRGRGWKYFDPNEDPTFGTCYGLFETVSGTRTDGVSIQGVPEQSDSVIVYDSNYTVISGTEYMIDYIDGRIITSGIDFIPAYVTYKWNYISLTDEWTYLQASEAPIVVVDIVQTEKGGYQLGSGKKVTRKVELNIFATSSAERNDLVDTLYDGLYLKSCPLMDFPLGTALDYNGTFLGRTQNMNKLETLFDIGVVDNIRRVVFENVKARSVNLSFIEVSNKDSIALSDLNAYKAKISFDMISYTDAL